MSDAMTYDKSNMPTGRGIPQPQTRTIHQNQGDVSLRHTDLDGDHVQYPSLSVQGMDIIEWPLPQPNTSRKTMTLQVREIPEVIGRAVQARLRDGDAPTLFAHYVGCLLGSKLLDNTGEAHAKELAEAFTASHNQEAFVKGRIQPWLERLKPQRRG